METAGADERISEGHLIHIGYAKAGSTFLQEWFAGHPELAYVTGGLAGYADIWDLARQAARPRRPLAYRVSSAEALAVPSVHAGTRAPRDWRITAEAQAAACSMLARVFPNARILLVTRGFPSVLLSSYSQYVRAGGTRSYRAFLDEAPDGLDALWNYDALIRMYEAAFAGDVIAMPFELLRDDPPRFVAELQSELGLSQRGPIPGRVNPSLTAAEMHWYPRLSRLVASFPARGRLRRRLLGAWVGCTRGNRLAPLIAVLERLRPAPPIEPGQLADELVETFRGRAEALRGRRLYAPYAGDYLLP